MIDDILIDESEMFEEVIPGKKLRAAPHKYQNPHYTIGAK